MDNPIRRPIRRHSEPSPIMGAICEVLWFLAAFCLLFGMAFLAFHFEP